MKGEAAEENVVGGSGVFGGGLGGANKGSAGDLDESSDDIGDDEDGEDQFGAERSEVAPDAADGDADESVDGSLRRSVAAIDG